MLPLEVAKSVTERGGKVHIVMVDGSADGALSVYPHTWVNWARLGRACQALERANISDVVFLGTYARPNFRTARPDMTFLKVLPSVVRLLRAGGDDAVLRGLIGVFEGCGLCARGVADVAPELIVPVGPLTPQQPTDIDRRDLDLGFSVIGALGRFDIGQAVAVADGQVLAIEGAEGTDRMLERVALMRAPSQRRSGVLVKCPKPGQDLRVDLPAIGPRTVLNADAARLNGIAVRAGQVLALERDALAGAARRTGVFVEGVTGANKTVASAASIFGMQKVGKISVGSNELRDAARGVQVLATLAGFETGTALVIRNKRVLSIGAAERAEDVIGRVQPARRHKQGVAVVRIGGGDGDAIVRAAVQAGLAGVVFDAPPSEKSCALADSLGVFAAVSTRGRQG